MSYPVLVTLHLFAAIAFVGTVFFEVLMLERVRDEVPAPAMREVETALGRRARAVMPWVLLVLYGAGIAMAWQHRAALAAPLDSSFAALLTLKIALAFSVFVHFVVAVTLMRTGRMRARHSRIIHLSVFAQLIAIVLLAKAMYVPW